MGNGPFATTGERRVQVFPLQLWLRDSSINSGNSNTVKQYWQKGPGGKQTRGGKRGSEMRKGWKNLREKKTATEESVW